MNELAADNLESSLGDLYQITRVIADTASDAILTINEESTMLFVNRAAEKIFGYSRAELLGQSLTMLMPDYLRHVHRAGLERYLTTGQRHIPWEAIELPGLHKSGKEIPLELSFGEFTENGSRFFTGIARDITERKESQLALQQRETYFRALIENATDIITVLNRDGTRRYVSPSVERSLGYQPEELVGKTPFDLLHPDDVPELRSLFASGLENPGMVTSIEYRIRHKDGSWRTHEAKARHLLDDKTVAGIVINSRDITDRKRLELRLTAQYRASRILSEADSLGAAAPDLLQAICESLGWELGQIWVVDREAEVLRWLASWRVASLTGTDFEEASRSRAFKRGVGLPGRVWESGESEWVSDIANDPNFPRAPLAVAAGIQSAFALPIMEGDQVSGVIEFVTREKHPPDQMLLEMMSGIGTQVGQFLDRERAKEERTRIFHREQRARHEVEIAIDRLKRVQKVTDFALAHLSLDELMAELLNRVREAMTVDTVAILLLESDGTDLVAWAAKGLEEEVELGVRIPVGAGFAGRVAANKAPVIIDDLEKAEVLNPLLRQKGIRSLLGVPLLVEGKLIGVMHVGKFSGDKFGEDDTRLLQLVADRIALAIDRAQLFEEERAARQEAEAASRAKDEFLTIISHELRTPLTPVIGWIHMIRNGILPAKETEHGLEVIEKNSLALKRLINDLLDMSAILSGKMRMEEVPVHLEAVVREAVETVGPLAAARDVNIELLFHEWQDEIVKGDRARLVQVFWNVLNNAVKFSSTGGRVQVHCEANGSEAIVRVEDVGQGIAAEFLPFVFDRFRQADGSKTRTHGGLGLGLSLAKSFVEAHHGTMQAESEGQGLGSRFTVSLPREESMVESALDKPRKDGMRPAEPAAHLLIVEDNADTLEVLEATFRARGFEVTTCESASDCLEVAPHSSVDLIISDIGMPNIDGFELMRRLRKIPELRRVPAIALTGYAATKDAETALEAGFDAHMSKPVDPAELTNLVNQLLKKASDD